MLVHQFEHPPNGGTKIFINPPDRFGWMSQDRVGKMQDFQDQLSFARQMSDKSLTKRAILKQIGLGVKRLSQRTALANWARND